MPKDGKDKSKDKSASKPVASQDGDSDIEEEQIKVRWKKLYSSFVRFTFSKMCNFSNNVTHYLWFLPL